MSPEARRELDHLLALQQRDAAAAVLRSQARAFDEVAEELVIRLDDENRQAARIKIGLLALVTRRLRDIADQVEAMEGPVVTYGDAPRAPRNLGEGV